MTPPQAEHAELEHADEAGPDSGNLRISHNTAYESGIPPARDKLSRDSDLALASLEQLELALVETTRAEANIGLLLRGLSHLKAGASAAREANGELLAQLEALRQTLYRAHEQESELAQRVEMLSQLLEATKREAERERELWFAQEDAFLIQLMTEYEERLDTAAVEQRRKVGELQRLLAEARVERDTVRTELKQITYERDTALAALIEPAPPTEPMKTLPPSSEPAPSTTMPARSQPVVRGQSSPFEIGSLKLRKPVLTQKPPSSSSSYSAGRSEVAEERLEGTRLSPDSRKK